MACFRSMSRILHGGGICKCFLMMQDFTLPPSAAQMGLRMFSQMVLVSSNTSLLGGIVEQACGLRTFP